MSKKPVVALRKPPPAVDPAAAEHFVNTGAAAAPSKAPAPASKASAGKVLASTVRGSGRRRSVITRADGRELRRMTVYLSPDLARRLAVYAAKSDTDVSAAIADICEDFLARVEQ